MKLFQQFLKIIFNIISSIIFFVSMYLVFSALLPCFKANAGFVETKNGIAIYIKSNGVHTDIILPVNNKKINWFEFLPVSDFEAVNEQFQYISLGWGDKGFYMNTPEWKDLTFSTAFKAAFGLGETAMHVTYVYSCPRQSKYCKKITISYQQYSQLITFILGSFEIQNNKPKAIIHPGYSEYDCFYEANGSYNMFKTCNVWTGEALKKSGIRIGVWTPFQDGIINNFD